MNLVEFGFQKFVRVSNGGIFLLNGLHAGVEQRILPYVEKLFPYIITAINLENCD